MIQSFAFTLIEQRGRGFYSPEQRLRYEQYGSAKVPCPSGSGERCVAGQDLKIPAVSVIHEV